MTRIQSYIDDSFDALSDELKLVVYFFNELVSSNGWGIVCEKWEDNILDQCRWTSELVKLALIEISKPKDQKIDKIGKKNRKQNEVLNGRR